MANLTDADKVLRNDTGKDIVTALSKMSTLNTKQITNTPIASFTDGADNIPVKSLVSEIVAVESGSGEKSPDNPYTISGFDSGIITRCGKNFFEFGNQTIEQRNFIELQFTTPLPSGTYTISSLINTTFSEHLVNARFRRADKSHIVTAILPTNTGSRSSVSFVLEEPAYYIFLYSATGVVANCTWVDTQIELGNTATTFEAYNGNNYTFDFGQTVYGGTLDVLTGVLTVDKGFLTFDGTETWNHDLVNNRNRFICTELPSLGVTAQTTFDAISNYLVGYNDPTRFAQQDYSFILRYINNQNRIDIMFNSISTEADFKSYLSSNPLQVCFELATPITYQLTPTEVKTLLGENNIFSNCGDINTLVYYPQGQDAVVSLNSIANGVLGIADVLTEGLDNIAESVVPRAATEIPIESGSATNTKDYIDTKQDKYWKKLSSAFELTGNATGTWSFTDDLSTSKYTDIMFCISLVSNDSGVRSSMSLSRLGFETYGVFYDYTVGSDRMYFQLSKATNNSFTISSTNLGGISSRVFVTAYYR